MGAFVDNPVFGLGKGAAEELWSKDAVSHNPAYRALSGLDGGMDAISSGKKAWEAHEKGDHLGAAKNGAKAGSSGLGAVSAVSGSESLGAASDVFGIAGKGLSAVEEMKKGQHLEAVRDFTGAGGKAFKLANKLTGDPLAESLSGGLNAFSHFTEGVDHFRRAAGKGPKDEVVDPTDKRSSVDRKVDETVLGTASIVETVGDIARVGGSKDVEAVTKMGAAGLKLGNKGVQMSGQWGLHGKDKEGHNRRIDDVVADKGTEMHDVVHNALGDGTASDILSHMAGGATMLHELPGAGVEAAGLGIAGYAVDAYKQAADTVGTVKSVVTNPKVQEFCAKLYMGLF